MIVKTSYKHWFIRERNVSHFMNPGCVSPASTSTLGIFAKSLACQKIPEDDVTLHFRVSIGDQLRDCVRATSSSRQGALRQRFLDIPRW